VTVGLSGAPPSSGALAADEATSETSFARGLRVLLALLSGTSRTVNDISHELDLPLSTTYRYLRDLRRVRLVEEVGERAYAAGPALLALALGTPLRTQLELHATPALRRLVASTGETAMLCIRVELSALVVAQIESTEPMRLSFTPGTLRPLHAGATARVLLAFEAPAVIDQVLSQPLESYTEHTIQDPRELRHLLDEIRATGYGVSIGEVDAHATAIAAPVMLKQRLLCSLSVTGPSARFEPDQIRDYAALLLEEAAALECLFG
jgi:DNA-binding IclR family transcriptional regulator